MTFNNVVQKSNEATNHTFNIIILHAIITAYQNNPNKK